MRRPASENAERLRPEGFLVLRGVRLVRDDELAVEAHKLEVANGEERPRDDVDVRVSRNRGARVDDGVDLDAGDPLLRFPLPVRHNGGRSNDKRRCKLLG